jgi:hypothetical protein
MKALRYARKLRDPDFPAEGSACVSVIEIPDNFREEFEQCNYDIGSMLFHATRLFGAVSIALAPSYILRKEPSDDTEIHPMKINLLKTRPDILPAAVSAILFPNAKHSV